MTDAAEIGATNRLHFLVPVSGADFYARQHNAIARKCHANSVCLSVCLSVTRVSCIKTAVRIIEILSLSDRPIILVFRHQE